MKNIGDRVPDVTFRVRKDGAWKDVSTDDLFKGKTVVLFALPGAFTPTCSSTIWIAFRTIASGSERSPRLHPPAPGWLRTSDAGQGMSSITWLN